MNSEPAHRTTYALRQQLNLAAGILLVLMVGAGCLALELARQQHSDTTRLMRWQQHERLADSVRLGAEQLVVERVRGLTIEPERLALCTQGLQRLIQQLEAFRQGDAIGLGSAQHSLDEVLQRLHAYEARVLALAKGPLTPTAAGWQALVTDGLHVQTYLEAVAAALESAALSNVANASDVLLAVMGAGLVTFLVGIWLLHRSITHPLQRMMHGIETMRRTGRLVKVPTVANNELGLVAEEFNHLADHVEEQKQRLRQHIVELQRVNIELDRLANLKDDFLASINHQLRTPLTAIAEGVQLLKQGVVGPVSPSQQELLGTMTENAERLMRLVEEVLDLTMLRSGRRVLDRRPADATTLLRQWLVTWQSQTSTQTMTLSCDSLPLVMIDPEAIRDVMDHLLRNALRHAPARTAIGIAARASERMVEVTVADAGPGLTAQQVQRLFQPFVHLHSPEAPGSEGSGMGLALCRQVIERHRGAIRADSAPGQGTTITFTIPIASPTFLFEDACRSAQEDAEYEAQQFGVVLIAPEAREPTANRLEPIETLLRRHTHRGDRFVRLEGGQLAIIAVTDVVGLRAMSARLCGVLAGAECFVRVGTSMCPSDGRSPDALLEAARGRLAAPLRNTSAGFSPQIV